MFNLDKFISDSVTFRPCSMFEPDIKANSEAQIRNTDKDEEEKERLIKETADRITQGEVLVLGTLAHLGHLAE